MSEVNLYDPMDVSVTLTANEIDYIVTGFAEGTFVTCQKTEDDYSVVVGAKGEVCRARTANPLGQIQLTLKNTSPTNAILRTLVNQDALFDARVNDANDSTQFNAGGSKCWVLKNANEQRGSTILNTEWTIMVGDYEQTNN